MIEQKSDEKVRRLKNDLVFISSHGTKIDRHNLRRAFNNAVKNNELANLKFHDLRHTFATRLAQKGVDLYKISKLLGREDIRMTQRYSHHCPESLRDGVKVLESDYNLTTVGGKGEIKTPSNLI